MSPFPCSARGRLPREKPRAERAGRRSSRRPLLGLCPLLCRCSLLFPAPGVPPSLAARPVPTARPGARCSSDSHRRPSLVSFFSPLLIPSLSNNFPPSDPYGFASNLLRSITWSHVSSCTVDFVCDCGV
jgi:hypothetical protein